MYPAFIDNKTLPFQMMHIVIRLKSHLSPIYATEEEGTSSSTSSRAIKGQFSRLYFTTFNPQNRVLVRFAHIQSIFHADESQQGCYAVHPNLEIHTT
jgi:hypothetical protein